MARPIRIPRQITVELLRPRPMSAGWQMGKPRREHSAPDAFIASVSAPNGRHGNARDGLAVHSSRKKLCTARQVGQMRVMI